MKILYFNVIEQNKVWGAEVFMNSAFQRARCSTHCIDYRAHRAELLQSALLAPPADVLFLQRGDLFSRSLIGASCLPRFFWVSELVKRVSDFHHLLKPPRLWNHVFFRTPACIAEVAARGWLPAERCSILLSSFDASVYRPLDVPKLYDICFVGAAMPRRKAIVEVLRSRGLNVYMSSAFGPDANLIFNQSKIVLNLHAEAELDTETRVYEALGSGAFLLTERLSAENPFFSEHLIECNSEIQLADQAAYYLQHDAERTRIASQGHAEAMRAHSYDVRAQELIAHFTAALPATPASANFNRLAAISGMRRESFAGTFSTFCAKVRYKVRQWR